MHSRFKAIACTLVWLWEGGRRRRQADGRADGRTDRGVACNAAGALPGEKGGLERALYSTKSPLRSVPFQLPDFETLLQVATALFSFCLHFKAVHLNGGKFRTK